MIEIELKTVLDHDVFIKEIEKDRRLVGTKDHKTKVGIIKDSEAWKNDKQNRTFHKLLDLFWSSCCGSHLTYYLMRRQYKEMAGLVKVIYRNDLISDEGKKKLWNAIKRVDFSDDDLRAIVDILKGRIEKEASWADATKKRATFAIDCLINDMNASGVSGSKVGKEYEEVLEILEKNKV